jgi:hypothetical protein
VSSGARGAPQWRESCGLLDPTSQALDLEVYVEERGGAPLNAAGLRLRERIEKLGEDEAQLIRREAPESGPEASALRGLSERSPEHLDVGLDVAVKLI